ncbi:MAG: polyamine aminopropyltransferase [Tissierellales bacterium]|nr:polyamine aminopropyltransferase [Tissierellales bacterium]
MELWFTEKHADNVRFSIRVKKQLHSEKSEFQQIDVFDTYEFGKILTIDGIVMITEKDEFVYHEMIVHVPMASNPNIKDVLVIGGGDGGTVRELTRYSNIQRIDMVEIDQVVVELSKAYFQQTSCKLDDKRVTLFYEDGIEFMKDKKDVYDLIIIDSTDPIGPGEGLFTEEFYKNCYFALKKNGIMVNQNESPYYDKEKREFIRANKKIRKIFPVARVYQLHIPTYPSGHWLFGFNSKGIDPVNNDNVDGWVKNNLETQYYNTEIHRGSFMLPNFVKSMISQ